VGVPDDGALGPRTLAAAGALSADAVRMKLLAQRLRFMSNLPNWPAFSRGWARRICDLMEV
jgi:lysozyme family protein